MKKLTAIVIGATGATGNELIKQLLLDSNFNKIKVFSRKSLDLENEKLDEYLVNFDKIEHWKEKITGDILFSSLGTTIKIAKTKENQYKIDYTYQLEVANAASNNKVNTYVLVSAYGANSNSTIFYSKMKGQLEDAIKKLEFENIHIFKPGILDRKKNDDRSMEKTSLKIIKFLNKIGILTKYKPMPLETLANKMIKSSLIEKSGINVYELNQIFEI